MSLLSQLIGAGRATRLVTHAHSVAGAALVATDHIRTFARTAASGAMTANTLKTLLSITGSGECSVLAVHVVDGTSRTVRVRVWVDNVQIFDTTSAANTTVNNGLIVAGPAGTASVLTLQLRFNASMVVEVASSLTETDKLVLDYIVNGT